MENLNAWNYEYLNKEGECVLHFELLRRAADMPRVMTRFTRHLIDLIKCGVFGWMEDILPFCTIPVSMIRFVHFV